MTFFIRYYFCC